MKSSSKTGSDDDFFSISILESRWYHTDCDSDSDSDLNTNDHSANFEMIMKISPLELQWGEEMEVTVKTPIVLHYDYDYLIKIEQVQGHLRSISLFSVCRTVCGVFLLLWVYVTD